MYSMLTRRLSGLLVVGIGLAAVGCSDDSTGGTTPDNNATAECQAEQRRCGDAGIEICADGAWAPLAACPTDTFCEDGQCVPNTCEPACEEAQCGDDGCEGLCGTCESGETCEDGICVEIACEPACGDRECGADGCDGTCGECAAGEICDADGTCAPEPADCGDNTCGDDEDCATCPADCGQCCGDDTCAATLGENCATCPADCGCGTGEVCDGTSRTCEATCQPQCGVRVCGDDGCDGVCGTCEPGETCTGAGACEVTPPDCGNTVCGGDEDCFNCPADCGQCCGDSECRSEHGENCASCALDCACPDGEACDTDARVCDTVCVPTCDVSDECGDDGCAGVCGTCGADEECNEGTRRCDPVCTPSCGVGDECGDDGCAGVCGTCGADEVCSSARRCVATAGSCANCTADQTCLDGVCRDDVLVCSAQNPTGLCESGFDCIAGSCVDAGAGCSAQNLTGSCAVGEVCIGGVCETIDGAELCDDDNPCTLDFFDYGRNRCTNDPQDLGCNDGNGCTDDACVDGVCVGTAVAGCVEPPTIEPVVTPTNDNQLILHGTKPAGASVEIDGSTAVAENPDETWTATLSLAEGENVFVVRSQDQGTSSATVEIRVVYDITPPTIHLSPAGGVFLNGITVTAATDEPARVYYTGDGGAPSSDSLRFRSIREFRIFDDTHLAFIAVDDAGNWTVAPVEADFEITSSGNHWRSETALAEGLTLFGAAEVGGKIIVAGGTDGTAPQAGVFEIDPETGASATLPTMSMARAGLSVVGTHDLVWAIGGENNGVPLNLVERINPTTDAAWTVIAPLPTTRFGAAAVALDDTVFVFGGKASTGEALTTVEVTNNPTSWRNNVAQMPRGRYGATAVADGARIYLIGGEDTAGTPIAEVDVYDRGLDSWTTAAPMPTPRSFAGAALNHNVGTIATGYTGILVAGGRDGSGAASAVVEEYIIDDDAWRPRTPLDVPRHSAAAVALDHSGDVDTLRREIWMLGGQQSGGPTASVDVYTQDHDYARHLKALPEGRFMGAAAATGSRFILFGGRNFQETTEVWSFDPETETYETLAPLPKIQNALGSAVVEDRVYALGGINEFGVAVPWVHTYDPVDDAWTELTPMPTGRRDPAVTVLGDTIVVIGGDNNGALQTVEVYDVSTGQWSTGPLVYSRMGAYAVVYDGMVDVFGGLSSAGVFRTQDQQLTDVWRRYGPDWSIANGALVRVHDRAVTLGGRDPAGVTGQYLVWDFVEDASMRPLPDTLFVPVEHQAVASLHGSIYVFGGIDDDTLQPPGSTLVQKLDARCFDGVTDGRETQRDSGGGCAGIIPDSSVRLVGASPFTGLLEVLHNGTWGTVCDDSWSQTDSDVACSEYLGTPAHGTEFDASGGGQIWLDDVRCSGSESSLSDCPSNGWGVHNCSHGEDVGLTCTAL